MKVQNLKKCVDILMQFAINRGEDEILLPNEDGYLTVTSPDWRKVYETPMPAVGSFSDDARELEKLLDNPERASAVDLDRVAHLLRLLSDQLTY